LIAFDFQKTKYEIAYATFLLSYTFEIRCYKLTQIPGQQRIWEQSDASNIQDNSCI